MSPGSGENVKGRGELQPLAEPELRRRRHPHPPLPLRAFGIHQPTLNASEREAGPQRDKHRGLTLSLMKKLGELEVLWNQLKNTGYSGAAGNHEAESGRSYVPRIPLKGMGTAFP